MREEIELLKYHSSHQSRLMNQLIMFFTFATRWNLKTVYFDLAFCGFFKKIDAAQHCALSRAASSDYANHFPLMNFKIDAF
jgi:hypothetical protein